MKWYLAENLSQFVKVDDTIEFCNWSVRYPGKKRWARVIRFNDKKFPLPMTEQIKVVEIRNPKGAKTTKFNPKQEQTLSALMNGKVKRLFEQSDADVCEETN